MKIIGLGANLPSEIGGPVETLEKALQLLKDRQITVTQCSKWYESAPVPLSDQPWYVNGVAMVESHHTAAELLQVLHEVEDQLGRTRYKRWEARVLDLDLLAYGDMTCGSDTLTEMTVPHPRLHERAFVLMPLYDIASNWIHPTLGKSVADLLDDLGEEQTIRLLENQ